MLLSTKNTVLGSGAKKSQRDEIFVAKTNHFQSKPQSADILKTLIYWEFELVLKFLIAQQ